MEISEQIHYAPKNKTGSKKIIFILKIIITLAILFFLAHHSQLQFNLLSTIIQNPLSSLSIIGLCYLMVVMHAWRWHRLNKTQSIDITFFQTIAPTYFGIAFNNLLPGSVGGDFVRLYYIFKKFPEKKSRAILSVLVDRICGLMGIFVIACLTIPYYTRAFFNHDALSYLLIICYSVFIGSVCAFMITIFLLSRHVGIANWITTNYPHSRLANTFASVLEAINLYRNAKMVILESIIASMLTQVLLLVVVILINKMLNIPMVPLIDYMIALVIGQIANLIPITPGGIGVGEAAFANILLLLNPGTAPYATIFFILRILSTLAYLPGVIFCIFGFQLLHRNMAKEM